MEDDQLFPTRSWTPPAQVRHGQAEGAGGPEAHSARQTAGAGRQAERAEEVCGRGGLRQRRCGRPGARAKADLPRRATSLITEAPGLRGLPGRPAA